MVDYRNTLTEELSLISQETKTVGKNLTESLTVFDEFSLFLGLILPENLSFVDDRASLIDKLLPEIFTVEDKVIRYLAEKHANFEVYFYRNGIDLEIDKEYVMSFEVRKILSDEVGGGWIRLSNEDILDLRQGDQIEFKWQSEGSTLPTRIFTGEIDVVEKEWNEEEARNDLLIEFQDWGKVLLERKLTASFPTATNINTILETILKDITTTHNPPYIQERALNLETVATFTATRTVDFVGESMWDCLKKLAFITKSEFFVDKNKYLRFFPRNSTDNKGTFNVDDFMDYHLEERDDLVVNTCRVYGHSNKPFPLPTESDPDPWTDSIANWACTFDPVCPVTAETIPPPYLGSFSVRIGTSGTVPPESADWKYKYYGYSFTQSWFGQGMNIRLDLTPPSGKAIELSALRVCHSGSRRCTLSYSFTPNADPDYDAGWTQIGLPVEDECAWRTLDTPIAGGIDQKLYMRFKTGAVPFCIPSCWVTISGFGVKYRNVPFDEREEIFTATFTLPTPVSIQDEEGYRKLQFHLFSSIKNYASGTTLPPNVFSVALQFEDGTEATYQAHFQGLFLSGWSDFELPIGPNVEGWTDVPQGTLVGIDFYFAMITNAWNVTDFIAIDGLHLDEGKWYGKAVDTDSMKDRADGGYGIKFKKIFDDTLYSDTAAQRWADETIARFKEPLYFITDVEAILEGVEFLEVGDKISLWIPETPGLEWEYRILELIWEYDEEEDLLTKITFERGINSIPVCYGAENIQNGDFENGTFSPWTASVGTPTMGTIAYSGSFSVRLEQNEGIEQTIAEGPISVSDIICLEFWAYNDDTNDDVYLRVTYTDDTTTEILFEAGGEWTRCQAASSLTPGKYIKKVEIYTPDEASIDTYIDNITCKI